MSYEDMNARYRDINGRGRYEMAIREQGQIYVNDGRSDIAALGKSVVAGNLTDVDSLIAAIVVGPNTDTLDEDGSLLAAVQQVWPTVAAALYSPEV